MIYQLFDVVDVVDLFIYVVLLLLSWSKVIRKCHTKMYVMYIENTNHFFLSMINEHELYCTRCIAVEYRTVIGIHIQAMIVGIPYGPLQSSLCHFTFLVCEF